MAWTEYSHLSQRQLNTSSKEFQYRAYLNSRLQLSDAASPLLGSRVQGSKRAPVN